MHLSHGDLLRIAVVRPWEGAPTPSRGRPWVCPLVRNEDIVTESQIQEKNQRKFRFVKKTIRETPIPTRKYLKLKKYKKSRTKRITARKNRHIAGNNRKISEKIGLAVTSVGHEE
jgi:hypothetical protein